jgi:hypothetical protein
MHRERESHTERQRETQRRSVRGTKREGAQTKRGGDDEGRDTAGRRRWTEDME